MPRSSSSERKPARGLQILMKSVTRIPDVSTSLRGNCHGLDAATTKTPDSEKRPRDDSQGHRKTATRHRIADARSTRDLRTPEGALLTARTSGVPRGRSGDRSPHSEKVSQSVVGNAGATPGRKPSNRNRGTTPLPFTAVGSSSVRVQHGSTARRASLLRMICPLTP